MNPVFFGAFFALLLATGVIVLLEVGRRIGARRLAKEGEAAAKGFGAIEAAVFALLGLILAFSFSGALTRFDARRHLVVAEANNHSPLIIWVMLGALTFACALFAGYDMASRKHLNFFHSAAFAVVLAVTVYVIIDLEYPRVGLIQMSDSDQVLVDLRESMK